MIFFAYVIDKIRNWYKPLQLSYFRNIELGPTAAPGFKSYETLIGWSDVASVASSSSANLLTIQAAQTSLHLFFDRCYKLHVLCIGYVRIFDKKVWTVLS